MRIIKKIIPEIRARTSCGFAYHVALMPEKQPEGKVPYVMRLPKYLVALDLALGGSSSIFDQSCQVISTSSVYR